MKHQATNEERQNTFSHFQLVRIYVNEFHIHLHL